MNVRSRRRVTGEIVVGLLALAAGLAPRVASSDETPKREVAGWNIRVHDLEVVRIPVNDLPGHAGCALPNAGQGGDAGLVLTCEGKPVPYYMPDPHTLVFVGEPDAASIDSRGRCYHLRPARAGETSVRLGAKPVVKAPAEDAKIDAKTGKSRAFPKGSRTYDPLDTTSLKHLSPVAKDGGYWFYQGDRSEFEKLNRDRTGWAQERGSLELAFDLPGLRHDDTAEMGELTLTGVFLEKRVAEEVPGGRVRHTIQIARGGPLHLVHAVEKDAETSGRAPLADKIGKVLPTGDFIQFVGLLATELKPGVNTLRIEPPAESRVLVQHAELLYEREAKLAKDESVLILDQTLGETTAIQGLPADAVVADLTALDVLGQQVVDAGAVVRCPKGHRLAAFVPSRAHGLAVEVCYASDVQAKSARGAEGGASGASGADWLAIAPRVLLPALEPLAAHRASQGLKTKLVALEDVDDAYGDGAWGARNLQAFLAFSQENWHPAPRFVLLAGDALRDARPPGRDVAWLPTVLVDTYENGASASDRMLLPEAARASVAIGRFPVRTAEECASLVAKTIAYEKAPAHEGQKQLAFVCGEGRFGPMVDGMIEQLFTQAVSKRVPEAFDVNVTYGNPQSVFLYPPDSFSKRVVERLSQGPLVFDYVGHGAPWALDDVSVPLAKVTKKRPNPPEARFPILTREDAAKVSCEPGKNPIVLITACWTGSFDRPERSVGEELVLNPRGAVAVFAASRVSHPLANALLSLELTENLFALRGLDASERPRLGERIAKAIAGLAPGCGGDEGKTVMGFAGMMIEEKDLPARLCEDDKRLFNLLGDPALLPNDPKLALDLTALTSGERVPGATLVVRLGDDHGPVTPVRVTLERARGVPQGVTALPENTTGRQLVEDPEVRKQVLATYAKANDPVLATAKIEGKVATLDLPKDLAPGHYVIKVYATPGRALVGSLGVEIQAATSNPTPPSTKKWF